MWALAATAFRLGCRGRSEASLGLNHPRWEQLSIPATSASGGPQPQETALIIAGHGDRGGGVPGRADRNQTILNHAERLRLTTPFAAVGAGLLKGEPDVEAAIAAALAVKPRALVVYPFFMANGYFMRTVLRERITALQLPCPVHFAGPLGLDPRLPAMMLEAARKCAESHHVAPSSARLLVASHGSKIGPASAEATRDVVAKIAAADVFQTAEAGFLEEEPFVAAQLAACRQPTVVIGFFSSGGMHAAEDVPAAIAKTGADAIYAGPIGASAQIPRLIQTAVLDCLQNLQNPAQMISL